jgi:predicted nuclease with TOPRIM domain
MIYVNGIKREATPEEIAENERLAAELPPTESTPEERIAKLETENAYLKEALELILSGATEVDGNG